MSDFQFRQIEESSIKVIDGDRGVNYPSKSELLTRGYCVFLNTGNVTKTGFDFAKVEFITQEKDNLLKKGKTSENDIILTTRGTVGNVAIIDKDIENKCIRINSGMVIIRTDPIEFIPYYLYLFFRSDLFKKQCLTKGSGSAQPQLPISALKYVSIPYWPIHVQNNIVVILSVLDAKIELNSRINTELEAMAKTLYDYWFVQFDFPDANGKPYKTDSGKMVYNPSLKRDIPEGWKWKEVSKLVEVRDGTHDSPKKAETGQYLITSKHLKKFGIYFSDAYLISEEDFIAVNKRSKVDEGDFLLSMIGTVGLTNWVMKITTPFAIKNIGLFKTSQSPEWSNYIYAAVNSVIGRAYLKQHLSTGTSQPYVTLGTLRSIPIVIPSDDVFKMFNQQIRPIHNAIYNKTTENQELVKLRDWLLPMLMNGQVTVKNNEG